MSPSDCGTSVLLPRSSRPFSGLQKAFRIWYMNSRNQKGCVNMNRLTGIAGETFFWCVQLWQVEMVRLGSKPNKPTERVFTMNRLIHSSVSVCTHVFVCVPACREKRIPLLPSPHGLYHTACPHSQTNNFFIRNLKYRLQGKFNSFIVRNSLLATFCLSGGAQE